jgi:hypothetical protein
VLGPSAAGWRETFAIRWIGMWPGESAYAQPFERPPSTPGLS